MAIAESMLVVGGYKNVSPGPIASEIDKKVCENAVCKRCKKKGMRYDPWYKPGSYIAIAVCDKCGYREEF